MFLGVDDTKLGGIENFVRVIIFNSFALNKRQIILFLRLSEKCKAKMLGSKTIFAPLVEK